MNEMNNLNQVQDAAKVVDVNKFIGRDEYARIAAIKDEFEQQQALETFALEGKRHGFNNVKQLYAKYIKSLRNGQNANVTAFEGQPVELLTGDWFCDDSGIYRHNAKGELIIACSHPILPVCRLKNIDTGREHMEIAFRRGANWQRTIVQKSVLASSTQIITLADHGVAVTSETARALVAYMNEMENLNYDTIPVKMSVSRLGYVQGLFSPYEPDLVFDGESSYKTLYTAVREQGDRKMWLDEMRKLRAESVAAKIVIAASLASALVEPLGNLPFFVHLWGSESGTGKTVALMAAASVWGDPSVGRYIQTFHSTVVGHERLAAFMNSLPMVIDELQLAATDYKGEKQFSVYRLAEGAGKSRGNKLGGFDRTPTWRNTILTSGETPMVSANAASGVYARVIEIECTPGAKIVRDGHRTAAILRENYGWGGREFIRNVDVDEARKIYKSFVEDLITEDAGKQELSAALILAADALAAKILFDDAPLTSRDILQFLKTKEESDINIRAYDFLCGWIAQNTTAFRDGSQRERVGTFGALRYGEDPTVAYIMRNPFREILGKHGYSYKSVQAWLAKHDKLEMSGKNYTVPKVIDGVRAECYLLRLPTEHDNLLSYESVIGAAFEQYNSDKKNT